MKGENKMRIDKHPILDEQKPTKSVVIYVDGEAVQAQEGEMIAAALTAAGIRSFRKTPRNHKPRGIFCAIGRCTDCAMTVDGVPNVRTCITRVHDGMKVETQDGLGKWGGQK